MAPPEVVMVYPRTGFDIEGGSVDLPMSVLAATTLVAQQYRVTIIDQRIDWNWATRLVNALSCKPVCVGISCMTGPQIEHALTIARAVRLFDSRIPLVWGGVHPTLLPEQTAKHPLVDYVVVGEGEQRFLDIVNWLHHGMRPPNIVYAQGHERLADLPAPPYHLLPMAPYVGEQGRFRDEPRRSLIFFGSRGCPYHCGYCCNEELHHGSWRPMRAETMYERASALVRDYRLDSIMFHDEDLFLSRKRVERLAELIEGKFEWWAQVRMDSVLKVDLDALYHGGLRYVQAGIESGSPRMLKLIDKGEDVVTMLEANRRLASAGIKPLYNFMMGFPDEDGDDLLDSVDVALQLLDDNPQAEVTGFYLYVPYPGTALYKRAVALGFKEPQSLEEWAHFTRQAMLGPWQEPLREQYEAIRTMSKFIDGTRMLRRLRKNSKAGPLTLMTLRALTRLYRRRWREHAFDHTLENKVTGWVNRRFFGW